MSVVGIKTIEKSCDACPSYWSGETMDGRKWRARYRWGYLSVTVDRDENKLSLFSKDPPEVDWGYQFGEPLDGCMTTGDMVLNTTTVLDFRNVMPTVIQLIKAGR